jgi:hypothetical protein
MNLGHQNISHVFVVPRVHGPVKKSRDCLTGCAGVTYVIKNRGPYSQRLSKKLVFLGDLGLQLGRTSFNGSYM